LSARLVAVAFESRDPAAQAGFWAGLLGREVVTEPGGSLLLPGDEVQMGLRFRPPKDTATDSATDSATDIAAGPPCLHLHVTSDPPLDQQARVEQALELGATHLDVGQLPEEGHVVLADPGGSPFCVIEAGNAFLAGCGVLGE
jgi:catechol 2,3-dioxygenase-like lactoylglutathione lyase family enzyme